MYAYYFKSADRHSVKHSATMSWLKLQQKCHNRGACAGCIDKKREGAYLLTSLVICRDACSLLTLLDNLGQCLALSLPVPTANLILILRCLGLEQGTLLCSYLGLCICLQSRQYVLQMSCLCFQLHPLKLGTALQNHCEARSHHVHVYSTAQQSPKPLVISMDEESSSPLCRG